MRNWQLSLSQVHYSTYFLRVKRTSLPVAGGKPDTVGGSRGCVETIRQDETLGEKTRYMDKPGGGVGNPFNPAPSAKRVSLERGWACI